MFKFTAASYGVHLDDMAILSRLGLRGHRDISPRDIALNKQDLHVSLVTLLCHLYTVSRSRRQNKSTLEPRQCNDRSRRSKSSSGLNSDRTFRCDNDLIHY